jgi:hypothetical protein
MGKQARTVERVDRGIDLAWLIVRIGVVGL